MKAYDELKAEREVFQQQMVEAEKSKLDKLMEEVTRLCKSYGFTARRPKDSTAEGGKKQ